jgi:hypothetical protein
MKGSLSHASKQQVPEKTEIFLRLIFTSQPSSNGRQALVASVELLMNYVCYERK